MWTEQVLSATSNGEKLRDNSSEISVPLRIYLCFGCCTVFWFHIMLSSLQDRTLLEGYTSQCWGSSCVSNAAKWCPGAEANTAHLVVQTFSLCSVSFSSDMKWNDKKYFYDIFCLDMYFSRFLLRWLFHRSYWQICCLTFDKCHHNPLVLKTIEMWLI